MRKENIYIDLSKCDIWEKKQIEIYTRQELVENKNYPFLIFYRGKWDQGANYHVKHKTELTYPEFIKLFEGGEEQKNGWIDAREEQPLCVSTGNWDGKQSDIVLAETFTGKKFLAQCYEGFMDGSKFYDWYQVDEINSSDRLITESVSRWMKIPF